MEKQLCKGEGKNDDSLQDGPRYRKRVHRKKKSNMIGGGRNKGFPYDTIQ
jgi:hypothetical protein